MKAKLTVVALVGIALVGMALVVISASPASAQQTVDAETADQALRYIVDNLWVLLAGVLVFLMQAGFAMVEAGMTRAKNVANIMAKNFADACVGVLSFFVVGYMIAYGGDGAVLGWGTDAFALSGIDLMGNGEGLTGATEFFFQAVFAATAVTIASGAMAERTKFSAYLIFAVAMTAFIYPVVVHWTWGGGIIAKINVGDAVYSDFAGSGVVHLTGAVAAFAGASMLGARIGKYDENGEPQPMGGHSIALASLGVFILWFGWFGFNAGSELAATDRVPLIALNTLLAAAAGGVASAAFIWRRDGAPDVGMAANGILGGLVGVTAGAAAFTPLGSIATGLVAGLIVPLSIEFVERVLSVDDPVGAVSVHGAAGVWGLVAVGLFSHYDDGFLGRTSAGLLYGGGLAQLVVQLMVAAIIIAFVASASFAAFALIKATVGLRVTELEELMGLDIAEHGTSGYTVEIPVLQ